MILYKFRPLQNLEWIADILVHQRLYCPHYYQLNDPFEGSCTVHSNFGTPDRPGRGYYTPTTIDDLRDPEDGHDMRLCSLSGSFHDIKLWSHYASGHKGVAIEIDFSGHGSTARKITYTRGLKKYYERNGEYPSITDLLLHKTDHWQYEDEYRILSTQPNIDITGRIKRVIMGVRCRSDDVAIIQKLLPEGAIISKTKLDELTAKVVLK